MLSRLRQRWPEMLAACVAATALAVVCTVCAEHARAEWKPEYAQNSPQMRQFFRSLHLTDAARSRLSFLSCCEHADRVKPRKYFVDKKTGSDEWKYLDEDNAWKLIPGDTIHEEWPPFPDGMTVAEIVQLKTEGVLFVYGGQVTCFWKPEGGI
jgi:hypothetical protein